MPGLAPGRRLAGRWARVEPARDLIPWHPTLGDVDSPEALAAYQEQKRVHKAEWSKPRAAV